MITPKDCPDCIESIPFGISPAAKPIISEMNIPPKEGWVYANWKDYTYDRYVLRNELQRQQTKTITIQEKELSLAEYLMDMSRHRFVLCPAGNGIDCYRSLEAIYCGSVPIFHMDEMVTEAYPMSVRYMSTLSHPILSYTGGLNDILHLDGLDAELLKCPNYHLSYWKQRFSQERAKLWL
jgi:hypothetical protein